MINLVPPTAKKKIVMEYWVRVVSVWLFLLSVVLLLVSAFLLPVQVLLSSQVVAYETSVNKVTQKVAEYDLSSRELVSANTQAQMLLELERTKTFSELVTKITNLENEGVSFSGFEFSRVDKKIESIEVKGESKTRKDLSDLRDSLLSLPEVVDVNLPISNLVENHDITFSLILTLTNSNDDKD